MCVFVCVSFFFCDRCSPCAFLIICLGRTLQLRGGAFLEDANQRRGHCAETGSWLGTYGLPHTDAHNLTVVFPTDTQHALKIGKGASWPPKVENGYQIDNEFLVEDSWLQRQPLVDWVRILVSSPAQRKRRLLFTSTHVASLLISYWAYYHTCRTRSGANAA